MQEPSPELLFLRYALADPPMMPVRDLETLEWIAVMWYRTPNRGLLARYFPEHHHQLGARSKCTVTWSRGNVIGHWRLDEAQKLAISQWHVVDVNSDDRSTIGVVPVGSTSRNGTPTVSVHNPYRLSVRLHDVVIVYKERIIEIAEQARRSK